MIRTGSLSGKDFETVTLEAISNRKAFGLNMAELAHLAKSPKAIELFTSLSAVCAHSNVGLTNHLRRILNKLLGHFPSLRGTFDQEGLILNRWAKGHVCAYFSVLWGWMLLCCWCMFAFVGVDWCTEFLRSLSAPKTVAWTAHLLSVTKCSGASSALPVLTASPIGNFWQCLSWLSCWVTQLKSWHSK